MDDEPIRDPDEEPAADDSGDHGLESEQMMPPGEDSEEEDAEDVPLKSIAEDVDGSEENEDIEDPESGVDSGTD